MSYSFQPKLLLSVFCLILIIVFSSLGIWQLQRANEKKLALAELEDIQKAAPITLNNSSPNLQVSSKAIATGRYLPNDQILLDNIVYKGKPGYYLLTPFKLTNTNETLLVNRGWLAKQTTALPSPETSIKLTTLNGVLAHPRSKPVILGGIDSPISDTPPLWYYMDKGIFEQERGYKVLPVVLRLDPEPESRFVRDWPKYEAKSGMHIGYAIQWFVFAFFVLIALVGLNFKKKTISDKNNTNKE